MKGDNNNNETKEFNEQSKTQFENMEKKDWDYNDLYPQRRGGKFESKWWKKLVGLEGRQELLKIKCERNAYWCLNNSPLVKVLIGALNSAGCNFDIRRHISCEMCDTKISGGFDPELNQVVICQNVATSKKYVQGTLTHEMIHMFDYCKNDVDFKNIDHLACTEIRAANLAHCSFMSSVISGKASIFNIRKRHRECVKEKALTSVRAVKDVTEEEAKAAIERVFPKCYADLEPIGRICRRNSRDFEKSLLEAPLYGYDYKL